MRSVRAIARLESVSTVGLVGAAAFFGASLAPSLLARSWVFQGVLSGVGIVVGYGLGALAATVAIRLVRHLFSYSPDVSTSARWAVGAAAIAWCVWRAVGAVEQHRWTWERLGYSPTLTATAFAGAIGVAIAVTAVLIALGLLVAVAQRWVARLGFRWLPASVAGGLALVIVLWALLASANTWVLQRTLNGMNSTFAAADLRVQDSTAVPVSGALRSGTPESAVTWAEVGHQGRRFLSGGPTAKEIAQMAPSGSATADAQDPVRVYVGRASADTVTERVGLAMGELDRLDAFARRAVLVVVPTGTGWVNEQIVTPPEYLLEGDIATVAVQYSHLPSPMAYLAEHEAASRTGAELIDAVRDRVASMPPTRRPMVLVAGESLGSFGGAEAFTDLDDMLSGVDRTLWVGPPESMTLRRQAERDRVSGSPQVKPVIGDGRDIVFANRRSDLEDTSPRSVFLQQADDPIVWWDYPTLVRRPDWLAEPLDSAVNPAIRWRPVSTFANLTVDMVVGNDFDEDHGHLYGTQPLAAWVAMLRPPGWDAADVDRLRARVETLER